MLFGNSEGDKQPHNYFSKRSSKLKYGPVTPWRLTPTTAPRPSSVQGISQIVDERWTFLKSCACAQRPPNDHPPTTQRPLPTYHRLSPIRNVLDAVYKKKSVVATRWDTFASCYAVVEVVWLSLRSRWRWERLPNDCRTFKASNCVMCCHCTRRLPNDG